MSGIWIYKNGTTYAFIYNLDILLKKFLINIRNIVCSWSSILLQHTSYIGWGKMPTQTYNFKRLCFSQLSFIQVGPIYVSKRIVSEQKEITLLSALRQVKQAPLNNRSCISLTLMKTYYVPRESNLYIIPVGYIRVW